jgi:hypothetical protein
LVVAAVLFLGRSPASPSLANFHRTKWTSENGIGAVFDLQQSADGYLWLTTSRGVLRFDGVRLQTVAQALHGAVNTNEIDSVYHPPSGGLWLTTTSAGLLFWKDERLTTYPDRRCTPTRKMGRLVEDWDGSLWVQGAGGLFRLRGSTCEQIGVKEGYPGGFAARRFMDRSGTLWVKTRSGPLLFLPRGESKFQVSKYGDGVSTSYAFLHEAPDGTVWLSDVQGLRRVEGKHGAPAFSAITRQDAEQEVRLRGLHLRARCLALGGDHQRDPTLRPDRASTCPHSIPDRGPGKDRPKQPQGRITPNADLYLTEVLPEGSLSRAHRPAIARVAGRVVAVLQGERRSPFGRDIWCCR